METALSLDELWRSDNPRWGTVREVIVRDACAAVLDDLNSDGREVELRVYERVPDGWRFVLHQDDVSGSEGFVDRVGGWLSGTFCYLGRAEPGSRVRVSFGELEEELVTGTDGWWLWVRPVSPDEAVRLFPQYPSPLPELRVERLD